MGGVGASGGLGEVAGPGATALGRSDTGRCPVGGIGAFSGRGREPGGSSPPTSLAHWLPMAYVVVLGPRRRRIGGARAKQACPKDRFGASALASGRRAGNNRPQCTGLGVLLYGVGAERKSAAAASTSSAVYV